MDLIMTAKCGILDRMVAGTFGLPLLPTVLAVTAFVLAHLTGRVAGHLLRIRRLSLDKAWPVARLVLLALAALLVLVAWCGLTYPFFVLRMIKDAYQCSYFDAGRDLQTMQLTMLALVFAAQTLCVAGFKGRWLAAIPSASGKALCYLLYAVAAMSIYGLALMVDPVLAPLVALFALPFACCGLGMLARQR